MSFAEHLLCLKTLKIIRFNWVRLVQSSEIEPILNH